MIYTKQLADGSYRSIDTSRATFLDLVIEVWSDWRDRKNGKK